MTVSEADRSGPDGLIMKTEAMPAIIASLSRELLPIRNEAATDCRFYRLLQLEAGCSQHAVSKALVRLSTVRRLLKTGIIAKTPR
jgi:hypothetical protein